jgi:hypothetical protein
MPKDKYVGKILFVTIPGQTRKRLRWIVSKRPDGRYTTKAPKIGARIRDLTKKRAADFGKETLLPKGAIISPATRGSRRQRGGDGSAAIPDDYPGMLVTAKPTTDELDDPDAVPTVMTNSKFDNQVDAEDKSDV